MAPLSKHGTDHGYTEDRTLSLGSKQSLSDGVGWLQSTTIYYTIKSNLTPLYEENLLPGPCLSRTRVNRRTGPASTRHQIHASVKARAMRVRQHPFLDGRTPWDKYSVMHWSRQPSTPARAIALTSTAPVPPGHSSTAKLRGPASPSSWLVPGPVTPSSFRGSTTWGGPSRRWYVYSNTYAIRNVTEFRDRSLHFRSIRDHIDTSSSPDVAGVFAALHAFERRRPAHLVRAGMAAAEGHGRKPGRPGTSLAKIAEAMRLVEASGLSPTKAGKQAEVGPGSRAGSRSQPCIPRHSRGR